MKRTLWIVGMLLFSAALIAGSTKAFFSSAIEDITEANFSTVELRIIQEDIEDLRLENIGSAGIYVRVRLVPQWSDSSLSVANILIETDSLDWVEMPDGYYYFKYYLEEGQTTGNLIKGFEISDLGSEYEGAKPLIKTAAEGVQSANDGWKDVWGIDELPFEPNKPWTQ